MGSVDVVNTNGSDDLAVEQESPRPAGAGGSALLDKLRARREALAADRSVDLAVPGYGGDLIVRLRPLEWLELRKIVLRAEASKNPRAELYAQAETIAQATVEVLGPGGAALDADRVLTFDRHLADLLGFEPAESSARAVVLGVMNGNYLGLSTMFADYQEWLRDATAEIDEALAEG